VIEDPDVFTREGRVLTGNGTDKGAENHCERPHIINPADWEGISAPPREWIVESLIPAGTVTQLGGDGAAGKSTLALQLAVARAIGCNWLSTSPVPGRTTILSAEDDSDEMHRRLEAILAHYGASFSQLGDMRLIDMVGQAAVLGEFSQGGIIQPTGVFQSIVRHIQDFRPGLVVIDALADAFGGNENDRSQARQFMNLLKRPARDYGCAFLCLSHPSLSGMSSGSGMSGSTAWSNSVRSRLYFETAKATDGSEPDPSVRTLTTKKANYAIAGTTITVRWEAGVYVAEAGVNWLDKMALEKRADETFMTLLKIFAAQGQNVSVNRGPTFAPTIFASHPDRRGVTKREFEAAMQRLLGKGEIRIETVGPPSRQRSRLMPA
jgi:RecA-family ATPase